MRLITNERRAQPNDLGPLMFAPLFAGSDTESMLEVESDPELIRRVRWPNPARERAEYGFVGEQKPAHESGDEMALIPRVNEIN